jgi:hypothetical protein
MSLREWIKKEWHVVEGNAKWDFYKWAFRAFAIAGAAVLALGAYLVHRLKYGPDWLPYAVGFVLALIAFIWMGNKLTVPPYDSPATAKPVHAAPLDPRAPNLRADIQEVLFHCKRLSISNDVFVLLRVSVVNHGEGEAVVTQWDLRLSVGDAYIDCEEEEIPTDWRIRRINPTGRTRITTEDFNRDASTFREPLRRGVPKERWVCFKVFAFTRMLPPNNAKFTLTLTDAFGHTHVTEDGPGFTNDVGEIIEGVESPPPAPPS